jgi:hypothetical protein
MHLRSSYISDWIPDCSANYRAPDPVPTLAQAEERAVEIASGHDWQVVSRHLGCIGHVFACGRHHPFNLLRLQLSEKGQKVGQGELLRACLHKRPNSNIRLHKDQTLQ